MLFVFFSFCTWYTCSFSPKWSHPITLELFALVPSYHNRSIGTVLFVTFNKDVPNDNEQKNFAFYWLGSIIALLLIRLNNKAPAYYQIVRTHFDTIKFLNIHKIYRNRPARNNEFIYIFIINAYASLNENGSNLADSLVLCSKHFKIFAAKIFAESENYDVINLSISPFRIDKVINFLGKWTRFKFGLLRGVHAGTFYTNTNISRNPSTEWMECISDCIRQFALGELH